jgi:hypothetical protein
MDQHFDDQVFNDSGLKTRPNELFRRNRRMSFEPIAGTLRYWQTMSARAKSCKRRRADRTVVA